MQKIIIAIILIVVVGLGGTLLYKSTPETATTTPDTVNVDGRTIPATTTDSEGNEISNLPDNRFGGDGQEDPEESTTSTTTNDKTFTLAVVAQHKDATSCYTAIRGTVYDLTTWISRHPGGASNILKICGKDGTSAFTRKHGGKEDPEKELVGYEIGILVQ